MKKFVKNVILFLCIVSTIAAVINWGYAVHMTNYGTMGECKNDSAYVKDVPNNIMVCNLGSSHGYYGFNYEKYSDEYICFNFALPSQSMTYDYRILENYKDNISEGAVVLVCLSYMSFYGENETLSEDFYAKNKRYYHFLKDEYIKEYDRSTDIVVNYIPSFESTDVFELVNTICGKNVSEDMWSVVLQKEDAKEHGLRRYKDHVESKLDADGNRLINREEIDAVYDIIELCDKIDATAVLITTPYLSEYTDAIKDNDESFYSNFYNTIDTIIDETGVEYYDYQFDERFVSRYEWFRDTDHLNKEGAYEFTDIVMKEIVENSLEQ